MPACQTSAPPRVVRVIRDQAVETQHAAEAGADEPEVVFGGWGARVEDVDPAPGEGSGTEEDGEEGVHAGSFKTADG